ncbi:MAG: hypothetical protein O9972_11145 [Burkholderiales bacterium]|nr:hypothetical protein [Burkholderiales bacterium]
MPDPRIDELSMPGPGTSGRIAAPCLFRGRTATLAVVIAGALGLGGCSTLGMSSETGGSSTTSSFGEFFRNSSSTQPLPPAPPSNEDIECPQVEILDGGSAIRVDGGGSVRHQLSLGQTARECRLVGNEISVKIGIEGRALLGPSGSPGTFAAPVRFVIKRGDKVMVSRLQRTTVTIPAGETGASFIMIEDNLLVPKSGEEMTIVVGFDPNGRAETPRRKRG